MEWADLLALLLLILPLVGMKPVCGTNRMNEEYLSLNTGKSLRGLFAIAIVLHHLSQEATRTGGYLFRHFAYTGYLYVAFFFFLQAHNKQAVITRFLSTPKLISSINILASSVFKITELSKNIPILFCK